MADAQVKMSNEEWTRYQKLIGKAWANKAYKERLMSNPVAVLAEEGIPVPPNTKVVVVEDTKSKMHMVIPTHPTTGDGEVSIEDLATAYAGNCCSTLLL